jgi:hypothetical protein
MRTLIARGALAAAIAMLAATVGQAAPAGKLAPKDIQATFFDGQPFTATTTSSIKYKLTFTTDGKMKRDPIGNGSKGDGTWRLSKDGFCRTWKGAKENCFTVVSAGDNQWSVMKGSTVIAKWSK